MSAFLDAVLARAKTDKQTIVLPEGDDERTLQAAEKILADGVADLVILGDAEAIRPAPTALTARASWTTAPRPSASATPPSCTSSASTKA